MNLKYKITEIFKTIFYLCKPAISYRLLANRFSPCSLQRAALLTFASTFTFFSAHSQQQEKGFELLQIVKIAEAYRNAPNLSYALSYTYADSTTPTTIVETVTGNSKLSAGNYYSIIDSVEYIQGQQYSLTVFYKDSTIIVNDRKQYNDAMKLPFLDSMFRQSNVDSMSVTQINSSTWEFLALFKSGTSYNKYKLQYDPKTFLIKNMQYYVKDPTDSVNIPSQTALVKLTISSYSTSAVSQDTFREDKFIYKSGGQFFLKPPYDTFSLVNNSSN